MKKPAKKRSYKKLTAKQTLARDRVMAGKERRYATSALRGARNATRAAATALRDHRPRRAKALLALARRDRARAKLDMRKARADARGHPLAAAPKAKAKAAKRRAKLASPAAVPGGWILGGNDRHHSCAAAAVANSLLAATGVRATSSQVQALYAAASGGRDRGATIPETITAARAGLAGWYPVTVTQLDDGEPITGDGLVLYLELQTAQQRQDVWDHEPTPPWGYHAGVLSGGHVITWGAARPVTTGFLAAQAVAWRVGWAPIQPAGGASAAQLGHDLPAGPARRHPPARSRRRVRRPGLFHHPA